MGNWVQPFRLMRISLPPLPSVIRLTTEHDCTDPVAVARKQSAAFDQKEIEQIAAATLNASS